MQTLNVKRPHLTELFGYPAMIAIAGGAFWLVRERGQSLSAPAAPAPIAAAPISSASPLLHLLIALVAVIIVSRVLGAMFEKFRQPPVLGEILAGIALGPSLLGHFWPAASQFVLPAATAPFLGAIAQIGVIIYMFLVGVHLDAGALQGRQRTSIAISHASIVAPFMLGSALALWLYPRLSTSDVPFTVFALFMGVSMSVTAFPVLARILTDRGMETTPIGALALACAAVDDLTAWCLLAFVVAVVHSTFGGALLTVALTAAFIGLMFLVVRPIVRQLVAAQELKPVMGPLGVSVLLVGLLVSALITEAIGIHALFGAFLLGALIPHDSKVAREVFGKLEDLVKVLLLPAFFAFTGMRTQLQLVSGAEQWFACGLIVLVATAGKFGGTFIAARLTGQGPRDSAVLGTLMNTRGLMELIVLNVGLELGVLSPTLFAMMVAMALITTFATGPVLALLERRAEQPAGAAASR